MRRGERKVGKIPQVSNSPCGVESLSLPTSRASEQSVSNSPCGVERMIGYAIGSGARHSF